MSRWRRSNACVHIAGPRKGSCRTLRPIMRIALPDPTKSEASALIAGSALYWSFWFGFVALVKANPPIAVAFAVAAFLAFGWLEVAGVAHIQGRAEWEAESAGAVLRPRPFGITDPTLHWRVFSPSYCRSAANVLGWNPIAVFVVFAILLASDAVAGLFLMTSQ